MTQQSIPSILVVDDDRNLRMTLKELLEDSGYEVREASDGNRAMAWLDQRKTDLVLCDWRMPEAGGEALLRRLGADGTLEHLPVIIMTAHGTGPNAMAAIQLGAYDFVTKPLDLDEVLTTVKRTLHHLELQREVERLRAQRFQDPSSGEQHEDERLHDGQQTKLVGGSKLWLEVFKAIGRVAKTDISVLLLGESGTGKELVARTIHENSSRSQRPFIVINCAALPHDLLESELFGHEKGAFTGALNQKQGKFESAAGGTVFLDEIGELPLALQPKLLRILQEHTFERLGGTASIRADFRVIAATNRLLAEEVEEKTFRSDLYYRLQAFAIQLPPLRQRRSDILPLAEYFLNQYAYANGQRSAGLADEAVVALQQYSYPGNVRELEHIVERAAVQASGRLITKEIIRDAMPATSIAAAESAGAPLMELPFHASVAAWEKRLIEQALRESHGNKADAARRLQIHRRLLYEKMEQLGFEK
ncbi:MAG: sigma-54-dependent transcriptional regulator [Acidobacteriaceae bacterium]